jgi:hypothetical protein
MTDNQSGTSEITGLIHSGGWPPAIVKKTASADDYKEPFGQSKSSKSGRNKLDTYNSYLEKILAQSRHS